MLGISPSVHRFSRTTGTSGHSHFDRGTSYAKSISCPLHPILDTPMTGNCCFKCTTRIGSHSTQNRDLEPIGLPTIRRIFRYLPPASFHAIRMKTHPALKPAKLLALTVGVILFATGATTAQQPPPQIPSALKTADGWRWPLAGEPRIAEPFDKPAENWLPGHRGVDLAAAEGDKVFAPQRGQVTFASRIVDRPVMVIDHGNGFKTSLEPVTSEAEVGDWVAAGAHVGTVSTGAHCSSRCIHWGVRLNGEYIDPVLLIRDMRPSILLPLEQ